MERVRFEDRGCIRVPRSSAWPFTPLCHFPSWPRSLHPMQAGFPTTLRCAGGWVRDKLMGRASDDIDVALDDALGSAFAEAVNVFLAGEGQSVHSVAVIAANPGQSKHLETARMRVQGLWLDLVNLRSEEYATGSRIPAMKVRGRRRGDGFGGKGEGPAGQHPRTQGSHLLDTWTAIRRAYGTCWRRGSPVPPTGPPNDGARMKPTPPPTPNGRHRSSARRGRTRSGATSPSTPCSTTSTAARWRT